MTLDTVTRWEGAGTCHTGQETNRQVVQCQPGHSQAQEKGHLGGGGQPHGHES